MMKPARRCGSTSCLACRLDVSGRLTRTSFFGLPRLSLLFHHHLYCFPSDSFLQVPIPSKHTAILLMDRRAHIWALSPQGLYLQDLDTNIEVAHLPNKRAVSSAGRKIGMGRLGVNCIY